MSQIAFAHRSLSGNSILSRFDADEYYRLSRFSRTVDLEAQQTLYAPGDEIAHAYFPVDCVITSVATMNDGSTVETAMVGREGVAGISAALGGFRARELTRVLLGGEALRVEASLLRELFNESQVWQRLLLCYYSALINQVSRHAVCNTRHRLSERLCTWLLMLHDRAGRDDIGLTQAAAARQLGVRRAGVNECVGQLQRANVLGHSRGHIRILDRDALCVAACVCYKEFEQEMRWHDGLCKPIRAELKWR
ncbi:MAG TPA: Crp/Fnr family transcriptional regulator [Pyrinomonadaceae bacterium]|nr:Crp/Fnr family transcriptional regulator [Pyrinomonadaceae bacterium]